MLSWGPIDPAYLQIHTHTLLSQPHWLSSERYHTGLTGQRSSLLWAHRPCHCLQSQQDPPIAEDHEHQRQEQAEDEQTADVGASCGRVLVPLDGAGGAGALRPIAAP